ncbi:MAG: biopolymer transporter ExbD [Planctomycetes bacterium]|nr:biopolymer transporter ExbD [Planctomycetota bacterium]
MKRRAYESISERVPNLAPMVDVIMVILVFFMLGASLTLAREGVLQTELDPRSGPGEGVAVEIIPSVKIALEEQDEGRGCRIHVNGSPVGGGTFEDLFRLMREKKEKEGADPLNPVVIGSHPGVQWRFVVKTMDTCVRAGFKNVQFAVALGGTDWRARK